MRSLWGAFPTLGLGICIACKSGNDTATVSMRSTPNVGVPVLEDNNDNKRDILGEYESGPVMDRDGGWCLYSWLSMSKLSQDRNEISANTGYVVGSCTTQDKLNMCCCQWQRELWLCRDKGHCIDELPIWRCSCSSSFMNGAQSLVSDGLWSSGIISEEVWLQAVMLYLVFTVVCPTAFSDNSCLGAGWVKTGGMVHLLSLGCVDL